MSLRQSNLRRMRSQRLPRRGTALLEALEPRTLLSVTLGGITIPGLPSTLLPLYTNQLTLGALNSYASPSPSESWWLNNTGQTLSNPSSGPATGTPGADINAQKAWTLTTGNSNVVIAVLDTGIDMSIPSLASSVWTNPGEIPGDGMDNDFNGLVDDVHGWNYLNNSNDISDNFVHGTAVAAAIHSVAPGVTILPVEIGTATGVSSQDVVNGINYIIALKSHGVNIVAINASYISYTPPSLDEVNEIKNAGNHGILYIAASGNGGLNLDSMIPDLPSFLDKYIPTLLPSNLIFVAATDNQDHLASFSDFGARTVAVGAPGVDITLPLAGSNGGLYAPLSGTSFAAPMVSGIAALLASRFPGLTMGQMKNAILNSGDLDASLVGKTSTGRRVDAFKALNLAMGQRLPTGALSAVSTSSITGWAFDANLGTAPVRVQLVVDGVARATTTANITQDALATVVGSTDHGFAFNASTIGYGRHTVKVFALDNATGTRVLLGQRPLIVTRPPIGDFGTITATRIGGWAIDPDTRAKSVQVILYIDGVRVAAALANIPRPDLAGTPGAGAHGFAFNLKSPLAVGMHHIVAFAADTLTGALTAVATTDMTVDG